MDFRVWGTTLSYGVYVTHPWCRPHLGKIHWFHEHSSFRAINPPFSTKMWLELHVMTYLPICWAWQKSHGSLLLYSPHITLFVLVGLIIYTVFFCTAKMVFITLPPLEQVVSIAGIFATDMNKHVVSIILVSEIHCCWLCLWLDGLMHFLRNSTGQTCAFFVFCDKRAHSTFLEVKLI